MNLELAAPITRWDEAIPLGNGLLGGLLWGDANSLKLSLDRGDLWDERPAPGDPLGQFTYLKMAEFVAQKNNGAISEIADQQGYNQAHPTKIPAGRIELDFAPAEKVVTFSLDFATATGRATFASGARAEAFFSAIKPYALLRVSGTTIQALRLVAPAAVRRLHYPEPDYGEDGMAQWFVQTTAEGHKFCVYAQTRQVADATLLATSVSFSPADGLHVLAVARARVEGVLKAGFILAHKPHTDWWAAFWAKSSITLPDAAVLRHYQFGQYLYGSASRPHGPPMPLQGVWTADEGELPPWKGDYHHDLNTQMTYMAYQTSGRFEEGRTFLDFMMARLPVFREFAQRFYDTPGAAVPGVMTLAGKPLGGWAQYSLSPTAGAWIGQLFYLHWRYTRDERFLRETALPWCREIGACLSALIGSDSRGVLVLPLSTSPEAWNNEQRAWLTPNSSYDLACLQMLFLALQEMAAAAGEAEETGHWRQLAVGLGSLPVSMNGIIQLSATEELTFSHRHFSTMMGLYPFNLLSIEGSEKEQALIRRNLAELDRLGVREWSGFSYSWMAALRARAGEGEPALWHLKAFLHAFVSRNGFHLNGDQTQSGFTTQHGRPFTLEGNLLAGAAVHEMVLQSWDAHPGAGGWGTIRLFPAMPWAWHDAEFTDLRAEGGCKVSAKRENNATTWFRITAARDGQVRIRDNFGGREVEWIRPGVKKFGKDFIFTVKAGGVIEAKLPKPTAVPPAPAGACGDGVPRPPANIGLAMIT
ncbi:MAG: glycoside hydrolase N-terminal domain-containing protein [Opitutaceae bacterium]